MLRAVWLNGRGTPAAFAANGREVVRLDRPGNVFSFPGGPKAAPPAAEGVLAVDWNGDFRTDLVLAGAGGLRFLRQADKQPLAGAAFVLNGAAARLVAAAAPVVLAAAGLLPATYNAPDELSP